MLTFSSVLAFSVIAACAYFTRQNIIGDIVVMIYLLIIPTLFIVLGAFSSGNPLGLVGAAREIKLMLAYELVFIMSVIIVLIKAHGSLLLVDVLNKQVEQSSYIASASGYIAFVLALIYFQAKLGIVPFDVAEAEQEIMAGTAIEYSGPLLGFYRLSRLFLYFSLPLFIITLLWPGKPLSFIYKYVLFILLVSVIKNVNPRLRIKDALIFFWFWLFTLGIVGIILAIKGF
jgi:NADH-quinone oxidoreductase subunit H